MPIILVFIGTIFFAIGVTMIVMSNWAARFFYGPRMNDVASGPSPEGGAAFGRTRS
jgi:hypothetical protein